jgi:membrane-associated protein
MEYLLTIIQFFLHLDKYLADVVAYCGLWSYLILFLIIFCETGLVVTPFLPGDSLLFVAGTLAANSGLQISWLIPLLFCAALMGDNVNYFMGHTFGPRIFSSERSRFVNKSYLMRAEQFYEKHGGKTVIIARFIPIIRTFVPFVAGIGSMPYLRFMGFNVIGAGLWIGGLLGLSYCFGNIPFVKANFSVVIMSVIALSLIPPIFEIFRTIRRKK